jgi:hypothetical protein
MNLEINNGHLPVVGYCDIAESNFYELLAEDMRDGMSLICNTEKDLEDEKCSYIFYNEYCERTVYAVFSGTVEFLGYYPDDSLPYAYRFFPDKEIKISSIGHCPDCGEPQDVILESKRL